MKRAVRSDVQNTPAMWPIPVCVCVCVCVCTRVPLHLEVGLFRLHSPVCRYYNSFHG